MPNLNRLFYLSFILLSKCKISPDWRLFDDRGDVLDNWTFIDDMGRSD